MAKCGSEVIPLPPSLKVVRDEHQEVTLLTQARQWIQKDDREPGVHASDLLDLRLAYWRNIKPTEPSEREVWLWLVGRVLHHFVLNIAGGTRNHTDTDTGAHEEFGILYSPDNFKDGMPIELKTTRAFFEPDEDKIVEDFHHYLEQLCIYMVLSNALTGFRWMLFINLRDAAHKTWPEPRCYRVELTQDQFETLEQHISATRDLFLTAQKDRNHKILEPCRAWKCGSDRCVFWGDCKPEGRWPEPRKKWTS